MRACLCDAGLFPTRGLPSARSGQAQVMRVGRCAATAGSILPRRGSAAGVRRHGRHARDLRRPPPLPGQAGGLSKVLERGINDAPGGLSISAVQDVDVEARRDDEQDGQDANHIAKVADTA